MVVPSLPERATEVRSELFLEYKLRSFQQVNDFMQQVAIGCDIAIHLLLAKRGISL